MSQESPQYQSELVQPDSSSQPADSLIASQPSLSSKETPARDWSTITLAGLVLIVGGWTAALPFSRGIQNATFQRFHLSTPSFACWVLQQTTPAMYNFENRYWLIPSEQVADQSSNSAEAIETNLVNHFPLRLLTFADHRYRILHDDQPHTLVIRSAYRGNSLMTRCQALPQGNGAYVLEKTPYAGNLP